MEESSMFLLEVIFSLVFGILLIIWIWTRVSRNNNNLRDENFISREESNFLRITLLCHQIGTEAVRSVFRHHVPDGMLANHLKNHKQTIRNLFHAGICTNPQMSLLYPGMANSKDFDFTLLHLLIRNTVANIVPTNGWKNSPSSGDISEGDDIVRIRHLRNSLAHHKNCQFSDIEFQSTWNELSQVNVILTVFLAITRLSKGTLEKDVSSLKTKQVDQQQGSEILGALQNEMLDIKGQVCVLQDEHISIQDTIYEVADILSSQRKDIEQMERRHIPDHVRDCQVDVLKDWKQEDIVFYEGTRVYDAALNMMENKKYLTFIGGPGSGKTATARHIALQLGKAGAEIVPVCGPEEVLLYGKSSINQVFILDDILGIFAVDMTMLNNIIRHQERLLKLLGNQSKLIFTCRKTVYKEALKFDSFITKNIVDLHGGDFDLSEEEKMKMLAQHCIKAGIDSSVYNTLSFNSAEIMLPFVCKLFAKDKTCHKFGSRFFNKPFECLINQMEILQGTNPTQYTAMVLCLVNENKISLQSLPDNNVKEDIYNCCGLNRSTSDRQIIDALKQITGTFVSEVNNEFTFIHDSIYEIVAFHFGTDHVAQILKYMPSHFVANKLIVCGESTFDNLKIKLSKIYFPLLADRMYSDIKDMHLFDVFRNTSLNNIQFLYVFINCLKQIPYCEFKLRILFRSPFDPRYVMKNVTREDENQEKDDDLIYDELTRQELLMDKHIFYGDKWKHCCHIHSTISWIVNYGHMHLFLEIVEHVQSQDESSDLVFGTNLEERSRMLILGCYSGNADIVELMLQYIDEESVNSSPLYIGDEFVDENFHRKQTPLTAACHFGYTNIADILIKYGADVNLQDSNFESPLYVAIGQGHCDIVKCLLSYNVRTWDIFIPDVNITNTAVDLAEMCGKENIVDLLMQFDEEDNYTF